MSSEKKTDIKIDEIIFGIRYQRYWHILDMTGDIIDKILRHKESPFDSKYFTKVTEEPIGKIIHNPQTECFFKINTDDLIFKHNFDTEKDDVLKNKDLDWFYSAVSDFIIQKLVIDYKIEQIIRVGIVYHHLIAKGDIPMGFINDTLGDLPGKTAKFNIDFHKKSGVEDSVIKKGVNDYKNVIYFLKSRDDENYEFGIDYQYYFKPFIDHIKEWDVKDFITKSNECLKSKFYPWMKKRFGNLNFMDEKNDQ